MKIIIDARMIGWTGIGRYTQRLLENLGQLDKENEYTALLQKKDWDKYSPASPNFKKLEANFQPYSAAEQTKFSLFLKQQKVDLVHFTSFNTPLPYSGTEVVTVHDLTLVDYKNVRGGLAKMALYEAKYQLMKKVLTHSLKEAEAIITPSEFVRKDLIERYKLPAEDIKAIYNAADKLGAKPEPIDRFSIQSPFLLYVGNFYPHKNIEGLLEAFALIRQERGDTQLVIAGKEDYFQQNLKRNAQGLDLDDSVIFTGYVSDGELVSLYEQAEIFVFPSLSEGFGLPPLEAMAYGTPVISSDASCMPEVLGDATIYFDPENTQEMAEEIDALLNSPDELKRLRAAGPKQAAKYSWRRMAQETLEVYKKALS